MCALGVEQEWVWSGVLSGMWGAVGGSGGGGSVSIHWGWAGSRGRNLWVWVVERRSSVPQDEARDTLSPETRPGAAFRFCVTILRTADHRTVLAGA